MGINKSDGRKTDRPLPAKRGYCEPYIGKWLIQFSCGRRVFVSKATELGARQQAVKMHAEVKCALGRKCIIALMEKKDLQ